MNKDKLFGCAYYEEYLHVDRTEEDFAMMHNAGINTVRIAESTWSTLEPEQDKYDFSHIERVLSLAEKYGMNVIIGTPTYALPYWLVQRDETVLLESSDGRAKFGARQNMDITNAVYLERAANITRRLAEYTVLRKCVIGYQIDNETKHYNVYGENVQKLFARYLKERFGTTDKMNDAFGLRYWSNSVTDFSSLPDVRGSINASYSAVFDEFRRKLAADFLKKMSDIVREIKRPDQFITQNFDYDWKFFGAKDTQDGYSHGLQPGICHYDAAQAFDIAGTDVYHFSQNSLTGMEIAFAGSEMYTLLNKNYLVLETQAQGFAEFLPFPGQLRLQAWAHIAAGADGILYWHWSSIHNSRETYWKGILSHDYKENYILREISLIADEIKTVRNNITTLIKKNRVAIMVSNASLSALGYFPVNKDFSYNDMLLRVYGVLYEMNTECDIIYPQSDFLDKKYDYIITPFLYSADEALISNLRKFVSGGGKLITFPASFFADENLKVYHDGFPHAMTDVFGMSLSEFTVPAGTTVGGMDAQYRIELITPGSCTPLYFYTHKYWGRYAAVTEHSFGGGKAYYIGFVPDKDGIKRLFSEIFSKNGFPLSYYSFPVIVKNAVNSNGKKITFIMNFSDTEQFYKMPAAATDILTKKIYSMGDIITIGEWNIIITEAD